MIYINITRDVFLAQGVLKRALEIQRVYQKDYSKVISRYPNKVTGPTTIADYRTQNLIKFTSKSFPTYTFLLALNAVLPPYFD